MRRPPAPTAGTTLHALLTGAAGTLDITAGIIHSEVRKVRRRRLAGADVTAWVTLVNRAMIGLCAAILVATGVLVLLLATGHEEAGDAWRLVLLTLLLTPATAIGYLTVARTVYPVNAVDDSSDA